MGAKRHVRFSEPTVGPALKPGCQAPRRHSCPACGLAPAMRLLTKHISNIPAAHPAAGPLRPMGHVLKAFEWPSGPAPLPAQGHHKDMGPVVLRALKDAGPVVGRGGEGKRSQVAQRWDKFTPASAPSPA